jgi:hypothetical protein
MTDKNFQVRDNRASRVSRRHYSMLMWLLTFLFALRVGGQAIV